MMKPHQKLDAYQTAGYTLVAFGATFALFSYLILLSVPLTSLGVASVILGAAALMIPGSPVPTETTRALLEGSCINLEAILEEFNARQKAVYLPPREERGTAYIPLAENPGASNGWQALNAPIRVVSNIGGEPGLILFPPGGEALRLNPVTEGAGVEDALQQTLVDFLELVQTVKAATVGDRVVVEMTGVRINTEYPRFNMVFGTLATSVAGSVISAVRGEPMQLVEEQAVKSSTRAVFRTAPRDG